MTRQTRFWTTGVAFLIVSAVVLAACQQPAAPSPTAKPPEAKPAATTAPAAKPEEAKPAAKPEAAKPEAAKPEAAKPAAEVKPTAGEVKVGVPLPLTGADATFGESMKRGMDLAAAEVNARGGVQGRKLTLVYEDNAGRPENTQQIVERMARDSSIAMLTGEFRSANTLIAAKIAEQLKLPYVVPSGCADEITQQGFAWVFRSIQPCSEFNDALLDMLKTETKPKTFAIVHGTDLFGTSQKDAITAMARANNIEVVLTQGFEQGSADFKPILLQVKNKNPDVVFFAAFQADAILLMRQSQEVDLNPRVFVGAALGFLLPEFIQGAGKAAEYVVSTNTWDPSIEYKGNKEFIASYQKQHGAVPNTFAAFSYAAIQVIEDALKRSGSFERAATQEALDKTDVETVFGRMKFEDYGKFTNQARIPPVVLQVQEGKYVLIWPKNLGKAAPRLPVPSWSERR